ncbi:MAG: phosphoadenylyl-sulfate reductase [Bacteroidetes bacterium]|nr:MAG: phosphoadenylyl-sulfate reductase [Bacteroidota bacterium]
MMGTDKLNDHLKGKTAQEILFFMAEKYGNRIALASSLGAEDQVLTYLIAKHHLPIPIFTLDTGRLFPETYDLLERTCSKYDLKIATYFPDYTQVQEMVNTKGINLFYHSVADRKQCCDVRKMAPLKRAFSGLDAWICGLRKSQSVTRVDMQAVEWDTNNGLVKVNPLIEWSEEDVWSFIETHNIPVNPLHKKNYPSIGCQPCTRAIFPGEDIRAGRWWWENPDTRECGLHKK